MANNTSDRSNESDRGLVGEVFADRFQLSEVVSAGANTIICDAVDVSTGRPVTVKIARPSLAAIDGFRREFKRRANIATALSHPNIAAVLAWGEVEVRDAPTVFWVVEHLGGGSLRDLLDRGRLLAPSQALVVGLEACRALDAAHQRGLVHTELTPSKLVFGVDGRLRIIDFAMAELLGRKAWTEPATVATHVARYASPEQALGLGVSPKTDVYALALSLVEAVTGNVPFAGDSTVSTLAARIDKLLPVSADFGSLASVLERAARPDVDDRFTASEFGRALVSAAEKLPRPEPIPVLATTQFDTASMRRPSDPTGGVARPPDADDGDSVDPAEAGDGDSVDLGDAGDDTSVVAAAAVGAAVGAAAAVAATPGSVAGDPRTTGPAAGPATAELPATMPIAAVAAATLPQDVQHADIASGPTQAAGGATATATATKTADDDLVILTDVADQHADTVTVTGTDTVTGTATGPDASSMQPAASPPLERTVEQPAVELTNQMPLTPTARPTVDPLPTARVYDDERPKRRVLPTVVLSLFIIAGVAAVAIAAMLLLRTKSYEVPDLAGVQEAVALNEVAGNDWVIFVERERSDEQPEENAVIRTFPGPGTNLDEGEEFTLFVSQGPEFRLLPELVGRTTEEAQAELERLQLTGFVDGDDFDEDAAVGEVLAWQVQGAASQVAGDQVLPGTAIALTVSKGPAPREVPDVVGLSVDEARVIVGERRLNVTVSEEVFSNEVAAGLIVSQDTAPGAELPRDGSFTVIVSKGVELIDLPDLEGLSFVEAQQVLTDAGFTIGSLLGTTDGFFESLSIDAEPVDGRYPRGTEVDLIFLGA